ncbi:uncharacterized protein LOC125052065 isoform X1 [Pieris napi]|uniref:uncharacterized protein LOC125052065 isoform X1 n=1 Tax=Pieris napi TaxID=78633 RepID=UPI001FBC039A|nr:uncharacterized protein LOC125052065 isoform X1 [Pieris napi]XP_047508685.1 uncharacterized protein LOC125052065 isoform X1 [Pieris napi]
MQAPCKVKITAQQYTDPRFNQSKMNLRNSVSDHVFYTYVCLVDEVKPINNGLNYESDSELDNDRPIQVERSKALHELVEAKKQLQTTDLEEMQNDKIANTSNLESLQEELLEDNRNCANILKLTRMKWLSSQEGSPESSSPSITPSASSTSTCSRESEEGINTRVSYGDKCLSTILRLDREHNLFGLSNIAIIGTKTSRRSRKDEKPAFPQTAIVQVCCGRGCCRHKSNTDLPASLKCGGCNGCCPDPSCPICITSCGTPCVESPCPSLCPTCPKGKCSCKAAPCSPSKCMLDCSNCFGMTIQVKRRPKYDPAPIELTPRSSCILKKPMAARSCHHLPHCVPPSSCFPYLMPCYWPARAGAPCNDPARCFHTPPCRPPRKRQAPKAPEEICPKIAKCTDNENKKCENMTCPGNIPILKQAIESRFGNTEK